MESYSEQSTLFEGPTPAQEWELETTKRALDELFAQVRRYRSTKSYAELIHFITHFRFYSPYNAMLIHMQMPGAKYVAPANRWRDQYDRMITPDARPLVILQPMGPVMFVFDVADTEPRSESSTLPPEVLNPFEVRKGVIQNELKQTRENAVRDSIRISITKQGSLAAGRISIAKVTTIKQKFRIGRDKSGDPIYSNIPVRYELIINSQLAKEAQYATLVHELAHLYCGHLGTINNKWWPDRRGLNKVAVEFEAESVTYLICKRLGIDNPSDDYLSGYLKKDQEIPNISMECVMKVTGLIEQMGKQQLKLRKATSTVR